MEWDAIGAIGEIIGATAVVLTVFYLAVQIRSSRKATNSETERHLLQVWDDNFAALAADQSVASIMTRGFSDISSLSEEELYVFDTKLASIVTAHYNVLRMKDQGFVSSSTTDGTDHSIAWLLSSKGGQFWYKHHKFLLPHAEHIDFVLANTKTKSYDDWWKEIVRDAKSRSDA